MPELESKEDREMFARMDRESITLAKPAVKHISGQPYYPEIMAGAQWAVGDPVGSHSEAKRIAQKAADELNVWAKDQIFQRAKSLYTLAKP